MVKRPAKSSTKHRFSYAKAGVDITAADAAKERMAKTLKTTDARVLNSVGSWAFASLFDARFPTYTHPVLVLKTEEPGTKQILAFTHDRVESICQDMINHLINDIAVMGATPLSVQDCIVCGKLDTDIANRIVAAVAKACKAHGCTLTGGETSEQPGTLAPGTYVLTSSVIGVVDKEQVIDGSKIEEDDRVLAVASNGPHTNGYTLIRALLKKNPRLAKKMVNGETFLDAILKPHTAYYPALKDLFSDPDLHGLAHITGSGIEGNLERVLPTHLDAIVDLQHIRILPVFKMIRDEGHIADKEMLRTYNMGVGLVIVCKPDAVRRISDHLRGRKLACYDIGEIQPGKRTVRYTGKLQW